MGLIGAPFVLFPVMLIFAAVVKGAAMVMAEVGLILTPILLIMLGIYLAYGVYDKHFTNNGEEGGEK